MMANNADERVTIVRLIGDLPRCQLQLEALVKLSKGGNDSPLEVVTAWRGKSCSRIVVAQLLIQPCAKRVKENRGAVGSLRASVHLS